MTPGKLLKKDFFLGNKDGKYGTLFRFNFEFEVAKPTAYLKFINLCPFPILVYIYSVTRECHPRLTGKREVHALKKKRLPRRLFSPSVCVRAARVIIEKIPRINAPDSWPIRC